jgi:hypothetical protein
MTAQLEYGGSDSPDQTPPAAFPPEVLQGAFRFKGLEYFFNDGFREVTG